MAIYINGIGNISPQATFGQAMGTELARSEGAFFNCQEPKYKQFIQSKLLRRMSRAVKMGLASSQAALNEAQNPDIDAIITGTAWGCVKDTEKFLETIIENNEQYLTPTAFVQSTHNTVAGQVALMHHNNCYNMTYVQGTVSFEAALIDATLHFYDNQAKHILVGGIDEQTDKLKLLLERLECASAANKVMGEGAAFFVLADQAGENSYAKLAAVSMFYRPKDRAALENSIVDTLKNADLELGDIDVVLSGNAVTKLEEKLFPNATCSPYKQLCGDYPTSTAFAMALAANLIRGDANTKAALNLANKDIQHIVIYNQDQAINHSIIVLSKLIRG